MLEVLRRYERASRSHGGGQVCAPDGSCNGKEGLSPAGHWADEPCVCEHEEAPSVERDAHARSDVSLHAEKTVGSVLSPLLSLREERLLETEAIDVSSP